MFAYQKVILQKVSFNNDLFKKELIKSIKDIHGDELEKFKFWVNENFFHTHYKEIQEVL